MGIAVKQESNINVALKDISSNTGRIVPLRKEAEIGLYCRERHEGIRNTNEISAKIIMVEAVKQ